RPRAERESRQGTGGCRRRQRHQAPHEGEPAEEHQGRDRGARSAAGGVERAARVPRVRHRRPCGPEAAGRRPARAVLREVQGSGRQMNRLRERYQTDVIPALRKEFAYANVMAVPKITKVVVNMGLGEGTQNAKVVDTGAEELGKITGQKAAVTRSKKSIAQ